MKVFLTFLTLISGCAKLHHVQVGDLDVTKKGKFFEIKISENGTNIKKAHKYTKYYKKSHKKNQFGYIKKLVSSFQIAPTTGSAVNSDLYAQDLIYLIRSKCPSGRITNLISRRESLSHSKISGEVIHITGICIK